MSLFVDGGEDRVGHFAERPLLGVDDAGAVQVVQQVFARQVRTGAITPAQLQLVRGRFLADLGNLTFRVVQMSGGHFQEAVRLLVRYGLVQSIRSLDALQLTVALSLRRRGLLDDFFCADHHLCAVATAEGLTVINPEVP